MLDQLKFVVVEFNLGNVYPFIPQAFEVWALQTWSYDWIQINSLKMRLVIYVQLSKRVPKAKETEIESLVVIFRWSKLQYRGRI